MAYNTKSILVDKDGNPISQYYNPATDSYEPVEGSHGANKVMVENNDLSLIVDKLSQLTGTVIDEETRKSNELQRIENEDTRQFSEDIRKSNELERINNEANRISSELARESNEDTRIANENARVQAEDVRATTFAGYEERVSTVEDDLVAHKAEQKLKVAKLEQELNNYKAVMSQMNINQEATQKVSGYSILSLPKNAANGQVSSSIFGNTITNLIEDNTVSPFTKELDSAKTYLLIKTDGGTVNIDGVDTAVPTKITGLASTTLTWETGNIGLYGLLDTEISKDVVELAQKYTYVTGTKSTVSAMRIKSVGKNLFDVGVFPDWKPYDYYIKPLKLKPNTTYRISSHNIGTKITGSPVVVMNSPIYTNATIRYITVLTTGDTQNRTFNSGVDNWYIGVYLSGSNKKGLFESVFSNYKVQLEKGDTATEYEPYKESTAYIIAKKDNKIVNLRSLPNGTKDEIRVSEKKAIIKIGTKTDVVSGTVINYTDMADGGQFVAYYEDGTQQVGIKGDTLTAIATTLTYQLAEPIITPIQVSGNLITYPSGTIYIEPVVADAGIYGANGIGVLHQELPINYIEKISKIDFETGLETELDTSQAIISEDGTYFTHPELVEGDIVFFEYYYPSDMTTQGETEVEYYDSRYVIQDSVTGKFYKWKIAVADGVPSIQLQEV